MFNFLFINRLRIGVPLEFLLAPVLSAASHFMGSSKISALDTFIEKFVVFSALLANPSTGKSPALKIISNSCYEIESTLGKEDKESNIANGGTVEALIELIKNLQFVLSMFDEGNAFLGSFGRYNGGSSYDRSIFLELYNAPNFYNRDLKSARTRLVNPRLNLCLLGHPSTFIKLIKEERENFDDGLTQRFLICAPKPLLNFTLSQIKSAERPRCSIVCILYTIFRINQDPKFYQLENDSFDEFEIYFNEFRQLISITNNKDAYLR